MKSNIGISSKFRIQCFIKIRVSIQKKMKLACGKMPCSIEERSPPSCREHCLKFRSEVKSNHLHRGLFVVEAQSKGLLSQSP